jgi:alpha-L-arabinofuranosidase
MRHASLVIDPAYRIAPVERRLFGSFVEHMGRCVYTGIYEPGHPRADANGFRLDVLDLVRELGVTVVRYPGGNFVSGYRWEDGIGPKTARPRRADLAWHSVESNQFGMDEFARWCTAAGVEPMLAVNLGTRGALAATELMEYVNLPAGTTTLADQRVANGAVNPYDVKLWCLGNEMDGPWQLGHTSAREYGRLAAQTAHAMRALTPDARLVVCGSSSWDMPTFGAWESAVLDETYDLVDMISCHSYYQIRDGDRRSFLASGAHMDGFITAVADLADAAADRRRTSRRLTISFDEWNVWDMAAWQATPTRTDWPEAPRLIEDDYRLLDAVVVGGLLIALLRHADRVGVACQAQLVNVIAPIRTEPGGPSWRQATFYPFALTSRHAYGDVLDVGLEADMQETRHGDVSIVDAIATNDSDRGSAVVYMINRSIDDAVEVAVDARPSATSRIDKALTIAGSDLDAVNSSTQPNNVAPRELAKIDMDAGHVTLVLPPASWTLLSLRQ